jgi:putative ABC transport system permease protein
MDFLNSYTQEQKALGRFPRPMDNRLIDVMSWLEFRKVVSEDNVVLAGLSFLFLMVCLLNTVGLLLAKFIGGASIAGIRRALGASRGALFRQHIVEISVIGLAGGLLGLGLAALGLKAVRGWFEDFEKVTQLDWSMVGIALGLALIASLAAGLYPTWRVCRIAPARYLKTQ